MILSSKQRSRGLIRKAASRILARCVLMQCCAYLCLAAPARSPLPSAGQVFDRYIRATGGMDAWRTKQSERTEIEGRAIESGRVVLRATVALARAGYSLNDIRVPEEAREGVYNGVAWAWTRLSGVRIKRGADREVAIRTSRMLEEADWHSLYPKSRVEGIEDIEGKPCYKVLLLPSADRKIEWFDSRSGLLARRSSVELSAAGEIPNVYTMETWRVQDGLKQPASMLASRGNLRYRLSILNVAYNNLTQPAYFRYPPEVEGYLSDERTGKALPNAEELIERHIFSSGGSQAYENLRTQQITGTLEFVSRNIEARTEAWWADNGRYYQTVDIPGIGKQEQGSDGNTAWERSPVFGPRARRSSNLAGLGITIDAAEVTGWRFLVDEVQTEAEETIEGHDCYRVRVTGRRGAQMATRWYDRKTGLLYRAKLSFKTEMGLVPAVLTYETYRSVDGFKWPVRIRMEVSGQEIIFKADEVRLNAPINEGLFELPDEIRTLAFD